MTPMSSDESVNTREPEPVRPPNFGHVAVGLVPIILLALPGIVLQATGQLDLENVQTPSTLEHAITLMIPWIPLFGVPLSYAGNHRRRWSEGLAFRFRFPGDALRGIAFGLLAQLVVVVMYLPMFLLDPDRHSSLGAPAERLMEGITGTGWIVMMVFLGMITPIVEETFFRGVLLRASLAKMRVAFAIVLNGLLFGLIHFQFLQTPAFIALGCFLAWRTYRTDRLGEAIFTHATFNLFTVMNLYIAASL